MGKTNTRSFRLRLIALLVTAAAMPLSLPGQTPDLTAEQTAALKDFERRVYVFVKLHRQVDATLPPLKQTSVAKEITDHQRELARLLVEARKSARQGDIFTPDIVSTFHLLIGLALRGANGANIRTSLAHSEPVDREVSVNTPYPPDLPLQSNPPSLLLNLPRLPAELDYRIVGNALVLRDVSANLVIDFMPSALPAP